MDTVPETAGSAVDEDAPYPLIGNVLVHGFATATAMWAIGYICRLPGLAAMHGAVLLTLFALCMVAGSARAARLSTTPIKSGALTGLFVSLVNLLVLLSVFRNDLGEDLAHGDYEGYEEYE